MMMAYDGGEGKVRLLFGNKRLLSGNRRLRTNNRRLLLIVRSLLIFVRSLLLNARSLFLFCYIADWACHYMTDAQLDTDFLPSCCW